MKPLDAALLAGLGLPCVAAIVAVAEVRGFLSRDTFPSLTRRIAGLALLFVVLCLTLLAPAAGSRSTDVSRVRLPQVLVVQALLLLFLVSWWLLAGRPPLTDFLSLRSKRPVAEALAGVAFGFLGWLLTLALGIVAGALLQGRGESVAPQIPPLVRWIADQPVAGRAVIVLSAMTLEEFFFRSFLQRRLGPAAAALLFLSAHAGYGEPLFFLGISGITIVLTVAYARTGSAVACMAAHGTFDAIQLFIVLPLATKALPAFA